MAEILSSIQPGYYTTKQTLTVTFPANTRKAIITRDDRAPVLTEVIAYDNGYMEPIPSLTPTEGNPTPGTGPIVQRPFIAVTQDGKGNVTFDGGFPKFYNVHIKTQNGGVMPALPYTSWSQLPPAAKYMNNCINFCANPRKLAKGNRKILLMGDCRVNTNYAVKSSIRDNTPGATDVSTGFKDTFTGIAQLGGWDLTIIDPSNDPSGKLNFNMAYFDQFAAVVYMASYAYSGSPVPEASYNITESCAQELSLYRMAGNGIVIITDHTSANYTSLDDAIARGSVFAPNANRVAKYFSAYFSGDVNRKPVLVGDIRAQLAQDGQPGDHFLLNGLADTDYIFAGGSESITKVVTYAADEVPTDTPWTVAFNTAGTYRVNVLVQLDDGTILTRPMRFVIINPSDITLQDSRSRTVTAASQTFKPVVQYSVAPNASFDRTMQGKIYVDTTFVGWFVVAKVNGTWNTSYSPLSGPGTPMPIGNGNKIRFVITEPFEYEVSQTINIPDPLPYFILSGSESTFTKKIKTHPYFSGVTLPDIMSELSDVADYTYSGAPRLGKTAQFTYRSMGKARMSFMTPSYAVGTCYIYNTVEDFTAQRPAMGSIGDAAIIAPTNELYYWDDLPMVWQKHPQPAQDVFGPNRNMFNKTDNSLWAIRGVDTIPV